MNHIKLQLVKVTITAAVAIVLGSASAQAQDKFVPKATYNFEAPSLVLGSALDFQDNWQRPFVGLSGPFVKTGIGFNTTRVAEGGSASQGGRADLYGSRVNDANFFFPNFQYNETLDIAAVVQADFRYSTSPEQLSLATSAGTISYSNTRLGFFGFNGGQFQFEPVGLVPVPGTINVGDWVRLRLLIDWTKNPGLFFGGKQYYNGAATLQYMNLTDGEATFTSVAGLSNVSIGTGAGGAGSYYSYYSQVAGYNEGLLMRLDTTSSQLDNIQIGSLIPEPTATVLLSVAGLLLLRRKS